MHAGAGELARRGSETLRVRRSTGPESRTSAEPGGSTARLAFDITTAW
jgi:hypothetical protein